MFTCVRNHQKMSNFVVEISEIVLKKLKSFKDGAEGKLLTSTERDNGITVLGLVITKTGGEDGITLNADNCNDAELQCPGGIVSVGSFIVSEINHGIDTPLVVKIDPNLGDVFVTYCIDDNPEKVDWCAISESSIAKKFFLARSRVVLPCSCEFTEDAIQTLVNELRRKMEELFLVELNGVSLEKPFITPNSRKEYSSLKDMEIVDVSLLLKVSSLSHESEEPKEALVMDYKKSPVKYCWFDLALDTLTMVPRDEPASFLVEFIELSLRKSLTLHGRCLISQLKNSDSISTPETFHFLLEDAGHFVSVIYPKNKLDRDLDDVRSELHAAYALPMDKPLLMRGNAFSFKEEVMGRELECPHEALGPSGVVGGEPLLVQGRYTYHHYCQQGEEDSGWGCAYRSLQTLCSWFKLQGYTNRSVPTIREIQQCLVAIGDKPSNFLGSAQWIGSTEVGFCLDTLLGVASRISTVSSGDEMSMKGGELSHHFRTQGTPVMIGGGNLAHTILGVDYNKKTGDIKFLILDPHYTGADDLSVIIAKGWCGWKPLNFWKKGSFYNMCMPIRPKFI